VQLGGVVLPHELVIGVGLALCDGGNTALKHASGNRPLLLTAAVLRRYILEPGSTIDRLRGGERVIVQTIKIMVPANIFPKTFKNTQQQHIRFSNYRL
jgi:hypothetical protein